MSNGRVFVDIAALYGALDAARQQRRLSWRDVAVEVGVSPSLLSRMGKGLSPDLTSFMTLCRWLRVPAERFAASASPAATERPAVSSEVAMLLAARDDVTALDREYLTGVIVAFERWQTAERESVCSGSTEG